MRKEKALIPINELDYKVPVPKRFTKFMETTIRIERKDEEFQYVPRTHTFGNNTRLSIEELELIVKELRRLNKR